MELNNFKNNIENTFEKFISGNRIGNYEELKEYEEYEKSKKLFNESSLLKIKTKSFIDIFDETSCDKIYSYKDKPYDPYKYHHKVYSDDSDYHEIYYFIYKKTNEDILNNIFSYIETEELLTKLKEKLAFKNLFLEYKHKNKFRDMPKIKPVYNPNVF